jgi:hypothetical protein
LIVGTAADTVGRLAVGTNNQLLAADSSTASGLKWANPGLTLINTTTFSAVTSVSLAQDTFNSTYDNYLIIYSMTTSGGQDLSGRMRLAGSDNSTASSYVRQRLYLDSTTVQGQTATATSWNLGTTSGSNISSAIIQLFNPYLASETGFTSDTGGGATFIIAKGHHTQAVAYDSFTLICSANMTGKYSVYGYNK